MPAPPKTLQSALSDRYALEREVGKGGSATVYVARDLKHRRRVAVKVLSPELAEQLGPKRFLREVETAASLTHPRIVPLYDSGDAGGHLFYVMPLIEGESLRARLVRERQLPVDEALRLTAQVAQALAHAHARGVIHRDVKPENILLHEGEALVTDFGIALGLESAGGGERLTAPGYAVGTPEYMSPEQSVGERDLDARSDVYSLACVLYEMLAGEPPFTAPTHAALITKRLMSPVPSVRTARSGVPPAVEQALTKALSRAPADRFASVSEFVEALTAAPAPERAPSVAVLPFLNLSGDAETEIFADGVTEDVIAHLSKIKALKVISRTSVMPFKQRGQSLAEIAGILSAATLLDGSVRRAGDRVRIVAQLIDPVTGRHLWGDTYDRRLTDIFEIQTDVALHIAAALEAGLSRDERSRIEKGTTTDLQAYRFYLQGRHWLIKFTPASLQRAIEFFERAIHQDPQYAAAHVAFAHAYGELGESGTIPAEDAYAKANAAIAQALWLDPALGEAHCVAAYLKTISEFDWAGAEEGFQRALQLSPNSANAYDLYGRLCAALGRFDEAIAMHRRSQELDPLAHRLDLASTFLRAARYAEAASAAQRAVEFDPAHDRAIITLGWAVFLQGMHAEGLAHIERGAALSPGDTMWRAQLGEAYALAGRPDEARAILRELEDLSKRAYVSPYHLAYIHAGLGEVDKAIDRLEQAVAARASAAYGIKGSFLFASLREHPRFKALLAKLNLS